MICGNCESANVDNARFCSGCGLEIIIETTRQSPAQTQQPTVADSLLHSTIAGKYRIDAKLGAGGMGTVYRATRLLIGDEVAVKILHADLTDPKAAERFRREAQASARLKHPNAVTIHDFGVTDDGLQYLVMESVEGESLRQIIKQQGPLTVSAAAEIVNQVCAALDEAHRHHIIHRDIKPDNIIVNVSAAGLRVKVLDFGIAKLRDDTADNLTQTGSILGTPHYMSPEQCLGEELDSRSDIYSLGVVLYEMLTGLLPFNSPTTAAVVVQQVTQPPPPLRSLNASISPAVEAAVLLALEKQRNARPQTAEEFARNFSASIEKTTRPVSASTSGLAVGALSGEQATTVVISRPSGDRAFSSPAGQISQSGSPGRRFPFAYVAVGVVALLLGGAFVAFFKSRGETAVPSSSSVQAASTAPTRSPESKPMQAPAPQSATGFPSGAQPQGVEKLVNRWVSAQNTKDFASYESCYGVPFDGIKRTKTGRVYHYDFNSWMKDRWQMISAAAGLRIEVKNLRVSIEGDFATVEFDQYYHSVRYSDWGPKLLRVKLAPADERIVYEELKASFPL
jgi:serine/threonine-protein kinase